MKVENGGHVISDEMMEVIIKSFDQPSPYSSLIDRYRQPVLAYTWRQRLRWRAINYRERIATAIAVLRGQHDCRGDDW